MQSYDFSTKSKVQMTSAMQKWKKNKRKTKAQKKAEMEKLQLDMIKCK